MSFFWRLKVKDGLSTKSSSSGRGRVEVNKKRNKVRDKSNRCCIESVVEIGGENLFLLGKIRENGGY